MNTFLKTYGQFIFAYLFLIYFIQTILNATELGKDIVFAVSLTLITYIQSVGEFFYFYKKKGKPRLQDWMRVVLFMMLSINFMKLTNNPNKDTLIDFSLKNISLHDATFSMVVVIFAFIALDLAYIIANTIYKVKFSKIIYKIKRKNWIFIILIFSTFIQGYLLVLGFSGYGSDLKNTTGIISLINLISGILNPFALIVSAYILYIEDSKSTVYKNIFFIILPIQVLIGLLSGMKENTIEPLLYVGIVFLIAGKKIPKKVIIPVMLFFIVLYPFMNAYRDVVNDPYLNTGNHALNMALAVKNVLDKSSSLSTTLDTSTKDYGARGAMFPYLQYAITIEPQWDYYKHMNRYSFAAISWLIPRALWAGKPRADIGMILSEKIVGGKTMSAVTPTNVGWAYLEGGLFFVVVIFLMLGIMFETIDRIGYKSSYRNPISLIFYITFFHYAIKPEWDPYFLFSSIPQMFIMYFILLKLVGIRKIKYQQEAYT